MPRIELTVENLQNPERIDLYLAKTDLGISRSQIKKLFGEGLVTINSRKVRVSYKVTGGELVTIDKPDTMKITFLPENIPIDIVYEDDYLAVVNKQAGMVTHPAPGNETGTLANALLYHFRELSGGYREGYPGLVHRLDKNTSGLLVVAKNDQVHGELGRQLKDRKLKREYIALIWGQLTPPQGVISLPIGRSRADRRIMSSGAAKTREAVTCYEMVEEYDFLSYIKLQLKTGRTHQIRTHLKESGHPIFGDPEYGGREKRLTGIESRHRNFAKKLLSICDRQLLHSARLEFSHPSSGELKQFAIDLPKDFGQVLDLVRLYNKGGYIC